MSADGQKYSNTDPDAGRVSQSCFDFLMIELVPLAERLAEEMYILDQESMGIPTEQMQKPDSDEMRDSILYRLDTLGYRVGLGVVESLTATLPLPSRTDPLDTIKFLCKDLWTTVFRKQIDNLKTNHRGVFVLTDNTFNPLRRCSMEAGKTDEARRRAMPFLYFPAGLIRGALSGLGMDANVVGEVAPLGLPGAVFQIRVTGAK